MADGDDVVLGRARSVVGRSLLRSRRNSGGPPPVGNDGANGGRERSGSVGDRPQGTGAVTPALQWQALAGARATLLQDITALKNQRVQGATALEKALSMIDQGAATDPAKAIKLLRALQDKVDGLDPANGQRVLNPQGKDMSEVLEDSTLESKSELRNRYTTRWGAMKDRVQSYRDAIRDHAYGNPPVAPAVVQAITAFQAADQSLGTAVMKQDYETSMALLDDIDAAVLALETAAAGIASNHADFKDPANSDARKAAVRKKAADIQAGINGRRYKDLPAQALSDYDRDIQAAQLQLATAEANNNAQAVGAALDAMDAAMKAFRAAGAAHLTALAKGGKKSGDARSAAKKLLDSDPDLLRELAVLPQGRELLDKMVAGVGSSAGDDETKRFVKEAMKARFNIEILEGDLTTKALPRLYKLLASVPEEHAAENERVSRIKRDKHSTGASSYGRDPSGGMLTLNLGKTGRKEKKFQPMPDDTVPKELRIKDKEVSYFDHSTLHEIGHAVDDKLSYMSAKGSDAKFGGWREESVDSVADVACNQKGFYADFPALPRSFLKAFLLDILNGSTPGQPSGAVLNLVATGGAPPTAADWAADPGIKQASKDHAVFTRDGWDDDQVNVAVTDAQRLVAYRTGPERQAGRALVEAILRNRTAPAQAIADTAAGLLAAAPQWNLLAAHDAARWCDYIRLRGSADGLWEKGAGGITAAAVGGRIYHQAYGGVWVSYLLSARSKGVSQYQFRAPGEWFSEVYAAYQMGLMPENHPDAQAMSWIN